jgi:hypothetical protein|nr:MAG TPA: nucleoid-associated protein [Caudoviricetes sp.]
MPIISNFPGGSLPEGKSGQFVGFDPAGAPVAKNVTAQDVAFTDGETFQTKYDSGELTGPAGQAGATGAPGKDGSAATVTVGKVTTGAAGSQAAVTNSGSTSAAVFDFTIPRGADGAVGPAGKDGAPGAQGPAGTPGKDAVINGVNALTLNATGGLKGNQSGSTYTLDGAGLRPKGNKYTLTTSGWAKEPTVSGIIFTQTLTVPGVLADESKQLIMPMPASDSRDAYTAAGISCTGQSANSLTFKCQTVPTKAITVYIAIQEVAQA